MIRQTEPKPGEKVATMEIPLRDLFAAFALVGYMLAPGEAQMIENETGYDHCARQAVAFADALMRKLHPTAEPELEERDRR